MKLEKKDYESSYFSWWLWILAEETKVKPKPLVMVGNKPIIWHIIQIYNHYDIKILLSSFLSLIFLNFEIE